MYRTFTISITLALFFVACEESGVNRPAIDDLRQANLDSGRQSTGLRPERITHNGDQYDLLHYNDKGDIVMYEFYSRDTATGRQMRTLYEDFKYFNGQLILVEHFALYKNEFEKTRIEEFEYDDRNRLKITKVHALSEIGDTWGESLTTFDYDENDRLIKIEVPGWSVDLFFYDSDGNLSKHENHPLFASDYTGPIVTAYTYDTQKNPFYHLTDRIWLPLRNGAAALGGLGLLLSPNNVVSCDTHSPQTGGVISKGSFEYEYNKASYPTRVRETIVTPLTDSQPYTETLVREYEYPPID